VHLLKEDLTPSTRLQLRFQASRQVRDTVGSGKAEAVGQSRLRMTAAQQSDRTRDVAIRTRPIADRTGSALRKFLRQVLRRPIAVRAGHAFDGQRVVHLLGRQHALNQQTGEAVVDGEACEVTGKRECRTEGA
jgi:hypothetical protein